MKHETTLYRGEAAVAYARRNLGAFLVADPELEAEYGHRLWNLEFNHFGSDSPKLASLMR